VPPLAGGSSLEQATGPERASAINVIAVRFMLFSLLRVSRGH
jgi:hypothetical protein